MNEQSFFMCSRLWKVAAALLGVTPNVLPFKVLYDLAIHVELFSERLMPRSISSTRAKSGNKTENEE